MKLQNRNRNAFSHVLNGETFTIKAGQIADIPDKIAKIWLNIPGIEEYADPKEVEALKEEIKELKKAKLKK